MRRHTVLILAVAFLAAVQSCGGGEVKQYTIEQFMDNVIITGGYFSHDETQLLVTSNETGIFNAYSVPVGGGEMVRLTDSETSSVFALSYFPEDKRFLFLSDRDGNEIYHIYMQEEDGTVTDLTPAEGARAVFYGWTYDLNAFLFGSNKRDSRFMDIYLMDVKTLKPKMIYLNDAGYNFGWISNDMNYMAFSKTITEHDSEMYLYNRKTGEVKHISKHEGDVNYTPLEFSGDSKWLYYLTDEDSDFRYLVRYGIETGERETVEEAEWDITYSYFSWNGKYRVTGINNDAITEIRVYEEETGKEIDLPDLPSGIISSVYFSRSERYMRFHVTGSRSPNNLYVYDFETKDYLRLTDSMNHEIDPDDLVEARIIRYESFDGEEIPSIFYRPKGIKRGDRIPALVYVHGGPGGQSRVGYSDFIQYLVNHGYAVLAVNNRGSSGYGKRFYKLDDMKHGDEDLKDCIEGKRWLIETGYVDPDGVGIIGGSYGGYMVLAALTFTPEEFAAGVDLFGISNWVRTLNSIPSWWENFREALYKEMGNPETDEEYLRSISPLFHSDRIVRPFMVLQGANDPRVLKVESDEIVEAARENGVDVEYIVFEDEGHGFLKKENRIEGYKAIRLFLDKHLKRAQ